MTIMHSKLVERVREELTANPQTKESTIQVVEENGVVTLRGNAASEKARQAAQEVAAGVDDVIEVINELQVKPVAETGTSPPPVPPEEHPYVEA